MPEPNPRARKWHHVVAMAGRLENGDIQIHPVPVDRADVLDLLARSDALMAALYPAESNHLMPASALAAPNVIFVAACRGGVAIGCGALVRQTESHAELKRIFVHPDARGQGVARRILAHLERSAREAGVSMRLEVGILQPEAIALYRAAGFVEIPPFGSYVADPLSLFMEKDCRRG